MENSKRGGFREGSGRKSGSGLTTAISYRMETDLLNAMPEGENRNKYINDSVRQRMEREGLLKKSKS